MQNTGLNNKVKIDNKIVVKAIKIASFINVEYPQNDKTFSVTELFLALPSKIG